MMVEQPLISVVMPCYNASKHLHEAVDSILNQTYANLEILLIDDGSSDNTREIIEAYAISDKRIVTVFNSVNIGLIKTLNIGVSLASGLFIARMDSDDISTTDRIEKLLQQFIDQPEIDVVSGGYYSMSFDGKKIKRVFPKAITSEALLFVSFFCTPVIHACIMAKANCLKENAFDEQYIHSEDYELFSRLLLNGYKFFNIEEPLYYIRKNPFSVSFKFEKLQIATHTRISASNVEQYFDRKFDYFVQKVMINRINFNVDVSIIQSAISNLEELKQIFVQKEKSSETTIIQLNEFLIEQKIDIYFQSLKYSRGFNFLKILFLVLSQFRILFSARGRQYINSKFIIK